MPRFNPTIAAGRLAAHLRRHGLAVEIDRSCSSHDIRLSVSGPQASPRLRLRVSLTAAQAGDAAADFHFGAFSQPAVSHVAAAAWTLTRFGIAPDVTLRRELSRAANRAKAQTPA